MFGSEISLLISHDRMVKGFMYSRCTGDIHDEFSSNLPTCPYNYLAMGFPRWQTF